MTAGFPVSSNDCLCEAGNPAVIDRRYSEEHYCRGVKETVVEEPNTKGSFGLLGWPFHNISRTVMVLAAVSIVAIWYDSWVSSAAENFPFIGESRRKVCSVTECCGPVQS